MKRLYRSRSDRMLGGVCGGLAEYFDQDVSLIRLAWIILGVFGGGGVLAYLVAWLVIPEEPHSPAPQPQEDEAPPQEDAARPVDVEDAGAGPHDPESGANSPGEPHAAAPLPPPPAGESAPVTSVPDGGGTNTWSGLGWLLIALGGFFLLMEALPRQLFQHFWPVLLIALGLLMLLRAQRRQSA